jgi:hypothetical protein
MPPPQTHPFFKYKHTSPLDYQPRPLSKEASANLLAVLARHRDVDEPSNQPFNNLPPVAQPFKSILKPSTLLIKPEKNVTWDPDLLPTPEMLFRPSRLTAKARGTDQRDCKGGELRERMGREARGWTEWNQ